MTEEERDRVAAELARARDEARARARAEAAANPSPAGASGLPDTPTPLDGPDEPREPAPPRASPEPAGSAFALLGAPDTRAVNELWRAAPAGGPRSVLAAAVERLLEPRLSAQRDWNAAQVRLDNALRQWIEERFAATHAFYDALLGTLGRRLDEADERHRRLEHELVSHVRELVRRLELATADTSRGRAGLELQLDDLRARLDRLERALEKRP